MLAKFMEEYKVVNSVGNSIGKIKDVYIDLNTWKVMGFELSPGALKKDFYIDTESIVKFDDSEKTAIIKDDFEQKDVPDKPKKELYPFNELRKHQVVDAEEEKVGKIYNLEIPFEKLKSFRVWKVLIKMGFKERRLRLNPSEIDNVMDQIKLSKKISEYTEEEEQ